MNQTDPTAEAVQYWYDAAIERREERDRLRAALARIRQMADYWEQHLPETIRTPAVVSALRAALESAPAAAPPSADRATVLREAAGIAKRNADAQFRVGETEMGRGARNVELALRRLADEAQPECRASLSGHCLREAQSESACDTEAGECLYGGRPADEAQQTAPAAAYGDGKGRVYCLGCASAVAASVPLTADDVDHWELCPTCGRHVVEVARATAETQQPAEPEPTQLRWGLNDVMWGDDDTITVMLSGPAGEPYWLELEPERAAVLREDLSGPDGAVPPPALTEEGRLAARVNVLEETVERARQLADTGAKCLRVNHQGQIEGARVTAEGWRFALSTALDLGTSAPWDAIHDRVKQLHRKTDGEAQR